jgi:hypothetical protein
VHCFHNFGPTVTDVYDERAAGSVKVSLALLVIQIDALAEGYHRPAMIHLAIEDIAGRERVVVHTISPVGKLLVSKG